MKTYTEAFDLAEEEVYLNCARMGPLLRSARDIGIREIHNRSNPSNIHGGLFFSLTDTTRELYCDMIGGSDPTRVIIAPATSYIASTVAHAISPPVGSKIICTEHQFPSNYYPWKRMAEDKELHLEIVNRKQEENYTQSIINSINENTAVVAIEPLNWGDGLHVDIIAIGKRAREVGAFYFIDGTQYIGAFPYDQKQVQADVLVSSVYKWLLSPYGMALAYLGPALDNKKPLEDGWMNRRNSNNFQHLTNYVDEYRPHARRFEVGEAPDMIRIPMLNESLRQLNEWGIQNIHDYLSRLVEKPNKELESLGFRLLDQKIRCPHLYGIQPPSGLDLEKVKTHLATQNIQVSYRNDVIRVSPNVYNTDDDMTALVEALKTLV